LFTGGFGGERDRWTAPAERSKSVDSNTVDVNILCSICVGSIPMARVIPVTTRISGEESLSDAAARLWGSWGAKSYS